MDGILIARSLFSVCAGTFATSSACAIWSSAFRAAKAAHATLTLALACRLVAVFCPDVQSSCRFDENVLHLRKFRDLGFCGRIAAQLIGDDLAGHRVRAQHALEEAFGGGLLAPLLHQDVEFDAMLVHRTPEQLGSPRSETNISSRCHMLPGLHRDAFTPLAKPLPNLSHQHRIVSYVTMTPRWKSNSSMSRKLSWKRKYQRTAQLMTEAGNDDRGRAISISSSRHSTEPSPLT